MPVHMVLKFTASTEEYGTGLWAYLCIITVEIYPGAPMGFIGFAFMADIPIPVMHCNSVLGSNGLGLDVAHVERPPITGILTPSNWCI